MLLFNPEIELPRKDKKSHPWEKTIKNVYSGKYKYAHNSVKNPVYPPPKKGRTPSAHRVKFTVVGTRTSKEFIYCMKLVNGLHKYRWRHFDAPILTGVTSVEWPRVWNDLKIKYGGELYCLKAPVAVFADGVFLGGDKELKELIQSKYIYYIRPDYYVEAITQFTTYMEATGRPCAHLEITINGNYVGPLVFMLYADIVPRTCDNFLRRCHERKGGYSGTPVHRIVRDGWIQCGGFGLEETDLDCENFIVPPDRRGVIAMANDGRHVSCSTQFFILLQPQVWMAFKYVAFGQLVIGENTLKIIEQVPIWYESPKKKIIISNTDILNLKCEDITVNKEVNKYMEGHIEDLVVIGEMFYEILLEKVFLETQFRSLQRIEDEMIVGEGESEITNEKIIAKNLRTTERFIRKKEEIDKQIEKTQTDRSTKTTPAVTVVGRSQSAVTAVDKGENNDFDVEEYEYVPEEYSYQHLSAYHQSESVIRPPEKPYYIPLTDVPYPGEVSSEFDLKRLLQGHYCLEADLDKDLGKAKKKPDDDKLIFHSEILEDLFEVKSSDLELSESQLSLDSDEEKEYKKYLVDTADRVSFAGGVISRLANSGKHNLFNGQAKLTNLVPDEALRKYRVAEYELRRGREKKVSITLPDAIDASEIRKEISRRQTGFVRPEDLTRMRQFERPDTDIGDDEDDAELDDYLPYTRQVSIQHPHSLTSYKKLVAKPSVQSDEEIPDKISFGDQGFVDKQGERSPEVFIHSEAKIPAKIVQQDVKKKKESHAAGVAWKLSGNVQPTRVGEFGSEGRRMSVLGKLMDDVVVDHGPGPTLKDYQPYSEKETKTLFLVTYSPETQRNLQCTSDDSRELYLARRHSIPKGYQKPLDQILLLQHGKRVYRKISTDYVKTIDHIEQKAETSLRSLEYAKQRPAMSIKAYQKKNKEYREKLAKQSISFDNMDKKSSNTIHKNKTSKD